MFRRLFYIVLISGIFFQTNGHQALAQTQENCEKELQQAASLFQDQKYDSVLNLVNRCLEKNQPESAEKAEVYKLLGKVKVAQGDIADARSAFREMLSLQPFTELNAEQEDSRTVEIFEEVRVEFLTATPTTRGGSKNWPWLVVSGAVVFTVGILLFSQ